MLTLLEQHQALVAHRRLFQELPELGSICPVPYDGRLRIQVCPQCGLVPTSKQAQKVCPMCGRNHGVAADV